MNRITIYLIILGCLATAFSACEKASPLIYDRDANIHFQLSGSLRDSIVYTFAYDVTKSSDTIFIPVRLAGYRTDQVRQYAAYVEQDSSTAVAGLHYEALAATYPMAANAGMTYLPLVIYNVAELEEKSVSLIIKLKATDDFDIEDPRLIRARVLFSARLEKPTWWNMWLGNYYSRAKHQLFLIVTEQTTLTMDGLDAPKNLYFANLLTMMMNDPFKWVNDNPSKGYVLTQRTGQDAYDFYHTDNPNRTLLLRKNQSSGRYFFIDENGLEIN